MYKRQVLEAASEVKLAQPAVALRVHDGMPEDRFRKGVEMIQDGQANPAFFSDKVAMQQVLDQGGSLEEARNWVIIGCIEPHPGMGNTDGSPVGGYVSAPKCLEMALHNGVDQMCIRDRSWRRHGGRWYPGPWRERRCRSAL